MNLDESRARIGHRGNAMSRAKQVALKAILVLGGAVTLVSAFAISLVFIAIGLAAVLIVGGYLWWRTRDLRRELRAGMQSRRAGMQSRPGGRIIEGEVISRESTRR